MCETQKAYVNQSVRTLHFRLWRSNSSVHRKFMYGIIFTELQQVFVLSAWRLKLLQISSKIYHSIQSQAPMTLGRQAVYHQFNSSPYQFPPAYIITIISYKTKELGGPILKIYALYTEAMYLFRVNLAGPGPIKLDSRPESGFVRRKRKAGRS